MHCNSVVHSYSNTIVWKEALAVDIISYWAVPIFFMLSGAKLMEYRKKYKTLPFLYKHISKIAIPWLAWCFIWFLINVFIFRTTEIMSLSDLFLNLYNGVINNEFQPIYWFFIPMIMVYFCIPVLSCLIKNRNVLWYIVIISFITYSVFPVLCNILKLAYNGAIYFPLGGGYVFYVLLGYLLSTTEEDTKIRHLIYCLGVISVILRYIVTLYLSVKNNIKDTTLWSDQYFTNVFLVCSVFLFFKNRKYIFIQKSKIIMKTIQYLASCSFGIYLVHYLVINFFLLEFHINNSNFYWRIFGIVLVYLLSLLIVSILKKVPLLSRWLVP